MLHDISVVVREGTPEWPGDTPFSCRWTWEIVRGANVNVSAVTMSPHIGTHADAPLHVRNGAPDSEALPIAAFIGRATVLTVAPDAAEVAPEQLGRALAGGVERLLLRTGRTIGSGTFPETWPSLGEASVRHLVQRGLRLLGVDAPSVDARHSTTLAVHHILFDGGAYNLENLDLRGVPDGEYELVAVPLRIRGLDAAPVRAILRST